MRTLSFAAAALLAATPLLAQKGTPARPALYAGADTNDAYQYYNYGLERLEKRPDEAAAAFYWALRINPGWADALYARRVALLLTDENRLMSYWRGDKRTIRSDEVRRIDSLQYRALMVNPFLYQKLDKYIFDAAIRKLTRDYSRNDGSGGSSAMAMEYEIQNMVKTMGPEMQAWLAYTRGDYRTALEQYASAMKRAKYKASLRAERGKIFFMMGEADSAYAEFSLSVDEQRKRDNKDLVYLYESKALTEQALGMIQETRNQPDSAREAYGRALQEDLAYYPAHQRLAFLAIERKDTTTALTEMELAVQLRDDDPTLRYIYGYTLAVSGKYAEAETQLRKAVELEPLYPLPHYMLGVLYEQKQKPAEAMASYNKFLSIASKGDTHRKEVEERLSDLKILQAGTKP